MDKTKGRINSLIRSNLFLACLCVVAVCSVVFVARGPNEVPSVEPHLSVATTNSEPRHAPVLRDMPEPSKFVSFLDVATSTVHIDESCADKYLAVLIYQHGVDYRYDPGSAVYNIAQPCVDGRNLRDIQSSEARLIASTTYYVVKADQGDRGAWYNPR